MKPSLLLVVVLLLATNTASADTVEERLRQLEDREQIHDLLAEYVRCLDARDHATYAQLFAKDGELTFAQGHAKGPEAIRALMEEGERRTDPNRAAAMAGSVHLLTDLSIQLKGDEATAHSRWTLIVHAGESRPVVSASGHYSDALIRENGNWKFKRREIVADLFAQASASCDRECLRGFTTRYLDAMVAHNPAALQVAADVKFTEDTVEKKLGEGLWKSASRVRPYRLDIVDVRQGVAAAQVVVEEAAEKESRPVMLMLRLKVAGQRITEVETQVTRSQAEGAIFDVNALQTPNQAMILTPDPSQRKSREETIKIAEFYPAGLQTGSFATVDAPFAPDAYRFENGRLMAGPGCKFMPGCENIKTQKIPKLSGTTYRIAAADEELGIVLLRLNFGPGSTRGAGDALIVWEAFKVYGGQIHAVEAFMKTMPAGAGSGWDSPSGK